MLLAPGAVTRQQRLYRDHTRILLIALLDEALAASATFTSTGTDASFTVPAGAVHWRSSSGALAAAVSTLVAVRGMAAPAPSCMGCLR